MGECLLLYSIHHIGCLICEPQLIALDRHDEARGILSELQSNADEDTIQKQMVEIQLAIDEERRAAHGNSYKALLTNGEQKFFHRTMLGIGGQFMQQLSGINLITYYAPSIFQQSVGLSYDLSMLLAGFNGVAYFFSSLIPIWAIDRLGRRKLMLFAAAGNYIFLRLSRVATFPISPIHHRPMRLYGNSSGDRGQWFSTCRYCCCEYLKLSWAL